jgi:hypothetical protein
MDVTPGAPTAPPAGWYADPQNAAQQRYWNGAAWTEHVQPAAGDTAAD